MLKVAIVCEFGTVNGGERSMLAALHALRGEIDPVILCPAIGPLIAEVRSAGMAHRCFDVRSEEGVRRSREAVLADLASCVTEIQPQILHANSLSMGRLTGVLASSLSLPCTAHLRDMMRLSRKALDELASNHRLFAVSRATREEYVRQGCSADRIEVLHNGVDVQTFCPVESATHRLEKREVCGLPREAVLLATIGQIGLRKGQDVLVAAAAEIVRRAPETHFVLIGERYSHKPESIAYEENLDRVIRDAGLADHWHRLGYRNDIPELLRAMDGLIHPANQEPLGRVLLEAAACGLGIVATDVGGTPEILQHEQSALLVPPGDERALGEAVVRLAQDRHLREQLGLAARERIVQHFELSDRARDLLIAWQRVLR